MKKIILSLTIAIIIIISSVITGCTDKSDENTPTSDNTGVSGEIDTDTTYERNPDVKDPLRIGVPNVSIPPMIIWEDGELTGFEMDLIAETAKRLGVSYEIIGINPGTEREMLEDDTIDCAWGNMMDTGKQRLFYSMTDPYITIPQTIAVYEDSEIKENSDIRNISVIMSSPAECLADENKLDINFKRVSASRDYSKTFEQLADGYSDAVICDKTIADYMKNLDDKIIILDESAAEAQYSVAFRQSDENMMKAADTVLKNIYGEGILSTLAVKWFGEDISIE